MFCWQAYSVDFEIYKRFNLDDNTLNKYFSGLDPENDINIPEWVNISGQTHNRTFTATPTSDFEQCKDHNKSGIFIRDYLLTNKTYEVIFQWDQRNNIDVYEGQTYEASILRNYIRGDDYVFSDDEDIYCFTPTEPVYCLEIPTNSYVKVAISYNGFNYTECNLTTTTNVFDSSCGNIKRYYKNDWVKNHKYYIKFQGDCNNTNYYNKHHNYGFTIKKVKPVILIHGIYSSPLDPEEEEDDETAFGPMKKCLAYIKDVEPVDVFDFPWNPFQDLYTSYCSQNNASGTLKKYVHDSCSDFSLKPVFIVHSMGGMLLLKQIQMSSDFLSKADSFIFLATPFCGADKASWYGASALASPENTVRLRRGTRHVWELVSSIPDSFFNDHNSTYIFGFSNMYVGGKYSDGVVSVSSANLPGTLGLSTSPIGLKLNHININDFPFPIEGDYRDIFQKVINHINE